MDLSLQRVGDYVEAVKSGQRPASVLEQQMVLRWERDLAASQADGARWVFDEAAALRAIGFVELMPHVKGEWARERERLVLQPWQCFVLANLFGWLDAETGTRRFREAYIAVPRKNGKSILSAAIGLYMFSADGEFGSEVYAGATNEKQAWEVYRPAKQMAERQPAFRSKFGVAVHARSLQALNGSRFEPVIGKPGDGASPHCAIVDEFHEHESDHLFDTMLTGMGARTQPLMLVITTAGSNTAGPCYAMQKDAEKVLTGTMDRDRLFAAIYAADPDDDWTEPDVLAKANPNMGVSVSAEFLIEQQQAAKESPRKASVFQTKHLNRWVSGFDAWMNMLWWQRQEDCGLRREDFRGGRCWSAVDLSSKYDITAAVTVYLREIDGERHYYVFGRYYLPRETAEDPESRHYQEWLASGELIATEGDIIDYARIEGDLVDDARQDELVELAFDPWGATQLAQRLSEDHGITTVEVPQTTRHLSEPMKMAEALTKTGRLHHDGNACLTWMVGNVVAREDANENVFPRKEVPQNKIDGAVAMIMALGRALAEEERDLTAEQVIYV